MPTTSADVRKDLVEALRLDLVGPDNAHPFAHELCGVAAPLVSYGLSGADFRTRGAAK